MRKISEDLVHGVTDKGGIFVNRFQQTIEKKEYHIHNITMSYPFVRSKVAQGMLKIVAGKLNLAQHQCKGLRDISASATFASSEIKVHRNSLAEVDGGIEHFYLSNCWLTFPPEVPLVTGHFIQEAREQRYGACNLNFIFVIYLCIYYYYYSLLLLLLLLRLL